MAFPMPGIGILFNIDDLGREATTGTKLGASSCETFPPRNSVLPSWSKATRFGISVGSQICFALGFMVWLIFGEFASDLSLFLNQASQRCRAEWSRRPSSTPCPYQFMEMSMRLGASLLSNGTGWTMTFVKKQDGAMRQRRSQRTSKNLCGVSSNI